MIDYINSKCHLTTPTDLANIRNGYTDKNNDTTDTDKDKLDEDDILDIILDTLDWLKIKPSVRVVGDYRASAYWRRHGPDAEDMAEAIKYQVERIKELENKS